MFSTRLTKLLGIQHPIIMGGMFALGRAVLAAAVSNAGGLGIITSRTFGTAAEFHTEVRKLRSLTDRPFGVNLSLSPRPHGVTTAEYIEICIAEGVPVIETSGRNPEAHIDRLKTAGVNVLHKVPGARYARTAERLGCDAVTVVGNECGGHPGIEDIGTLVMVRKAVQSVRIPVVAAGGFADGHGLLAALSLGAEGILMGTRFIATQECEIHPQAKRWMITASEEDAVIVHRSLKKPWRVARNALAQTVLSMEQKGATVDDLRPFITGERTPLVHSEGKFDEALWSVGQAVGLVQDLPTCQELIDRILAEAHEAAAHVCGMMT